MFASLARRLSRLSRTTGVAVGAQAASVEPPQERETGWHASSWAMQQGVEVIELSPSTAADLFPDTQPAYRWPDIDPPRRAA